MALAKDDTQQRALYLLENELATGENQADFERIKELAHSEPEAAAFLIFTLLPYYQKEPETDPSIPSGQIPPYQKPSADESDKTPGRKKGHPGARRPQPSRIDRRDEHSVDQCPDCGGHVRPIKGKHGKRTRIIEDIPQTIETEITEHTIHRAYCPCCQKPVEPTVPDAMPSATIGNRLLTITAYWHYNLGISLSSIQDMLNHTLHTSVSAGGLAQMWQRLAEHLEGWYDEIAAQIRSAPVVHGDETSWRVNGETQWIWSFSAHPSTLYLVHPSRGSPALLEFFQETFDGTLVTDFWGAYNLLDAANRQLCVGHLL